MFYKKAALKKFAFRPKKRLQRRRFPVNIVNFLRTPILWILLLICFTQKCVNQALLVPLFGSCIRKYEIGFLFVYLLLDFKAEIPFL